MPKLPIKLGTEITEDEWEQIFTVACSAKASARRELLEELRQSGNEEASIILHSVRTAREKINAALSGAGLPFRILKTDEAKGKSGIPGSFVRVFRVKYNNEKARR